MFAPLLIRASSVVENPSCKSAGVGQCEPIDALVKVLVIGVGHGSMCARYII